jgi:hypothetical protein
MKCVDCPIRFKCDELVPDEEYCPIEVYEKVQKILDERKEKEVKNVI